MNRIRRNLKTPARRELTSDLALKKPGKVYNQARILWKRGGGMELEKKIIAVIIELLEKQENVKIEYRLEKKNTEEGTA